METYEIKFQQAYEACRDDDGVLRYKGYTGGNAISLYFEEIFSINLAENNQAHNAVCDYLRTKENEV